jgi:hypothetical protein
MIQAARHRYAAMSSEECNQTTGQLTRLMLLLLRITAKRLLHQFRNIFTSSVTPSSAGWVSRTSIGAGLLSWLLQTSDYG